MTNLIITSAPRSGSTPLAKLLGQQKDIFVTNELGIYDDWDNKNKWQNFIHSKEWINFVENEIIFEAHGLDLYKFRNDVISKKMSGKDIHEWITLNTNAGIVGDKCPITYLHNMPAFINKFPDAKFIFIYRDGRDTVASQIRWFQKAPPGHKDHAAHWMFPDVKTAQKLWVNISKLMISRMNLVGPDKLMIIKYEDMANDADNYCKKISDFVGTEVVNINNFFKPINQNQWQVDHPSMMDELSQEFKKILEYLNYE